MNKFIIKCGVFSLIALVACSSSFGKSVSDNCVNKLATPEANLIIGDAPAAKIVRLPLVEVNKIARNTENMSHVFSSGVTVIKKKFTPDLDYSYVENEDGSVCSSMQVNISVDLAEIVIYIASEFEEGSAAFNEVLAHEREHVAFYSKEFQRTLPEKFKAEVDGFLRKSYINAASVDAAVKMHTNNAWKIVDNILVKSIRDAEKFHEKIDDKEEMKRITRIIAESGALTNALKN